MINVTSNNPSQLKYEGPILKEDLRKEVELLSIPRNYTEEPENNKKVFQHILDRFLGCGYETRVIGQDRNIFAFSKDYNRHGGPYTLVGAHYDSVPETPGADDNASAIVAMLQIAAAFRGERTNLLFAAFNQEEDGLLGSRTVAKQLRGGKG
jgi:hypothetical protein